MIEGISIIILTYNEEIHIERCIRSLLPISKNIFVVDSFSSDNTTELAEALGAKIIQRNFVNQAEQFQWALDNLPIEDDWIMRMDADEYIETTLQKEIELFFSASPESIDGIYLNRKHIFYDKWIKHGGRYPLKLLRIWKRGKGRMEQRWMDEHIVLNKGSKSVEFKGGFCDDNLKGISFFVSKHNSYATREAIDILNNKYDLFEKDESINTVDDSQAKQKRMLKNGLYSNLPLGARAGFYFLFRYFLQLGFLDGRKGFIYHFMQGLWYRLLVDLKIYEIEKEAGGNVNIIKKILHDKHGINIR